VAPRQQSDHGGAAPQTRPTKTMLGTKSKQISNIRRIVQPAIVQKISQAPAALHLRFNQ